MNVSLLLSALLLLACGEAFSQTSPSMSMPPAGKASAAPATPSSTLTDAVVTAVDKSRGFVTLNIGTPGGTAILSDHTTPNGILQNAGTINVSTESAVEATFSNSGTGQLNINTFGGVFVVENAQTIAGTVTQRQVGLASC